MASLPALARHAGAGEGWRDASTLFVSRLKPVTLAVHEWLDCDYCLVAHTRAARELGLTEIDIKLARQGSATDQRVAAMVAFGPQVIAAPAEITDEQIDELRALGYGDEQIAVVVGLVSLQS